ncbi:bifunctional diguanylate cyclase/phosphodiesterase [Actinoplanes sp. NEAU-A12]|uniref:Bifunctional diguanylate cyclase/phosphodiesterase n=1 Tax=Actinoplanes sandaracinus TaxID=3045177 RepID=A0ABT6WGE8_9ACTN|nr:bifunctional diguanylate cyclase/phosphodiesterase [Actinoplanes sandaracinus]MDI6098780.1 bifunctional diguanylate cyclase/phosphodiesterase [Actinoplanes sandaracinus]
MRSPEPVRPRAYACYGWLAVAASVALVAPHLGPAGQQCAYALIGLGSAACVAAGVRLHRPARPVAWLLLAIAMVCGAAANTVWAVHVSLTAAPSLSAVDVLYFVMYPLLAAGLALLPERPAGSSRWAGTAEAGIVTCTGATLAWVGLYDPYILDADPSPPYSGAIAYPILDLLLVAMAVRLLVVQRRLRHTHAILLAMAVLLTAADVPYFLSVATGGPWSGPGWSVAAWLAAFALPGVAALHPATAAHPALPDPVGGGWRTAMLHGALVLVGPAATGYSLMQDAHRGDLDLYDFIVPLSATVLISLLLVVRMTNGQRQLQRHAMSLAVALDEQAALQESLRHLAEHDVLTGLPNRRLLEDRIAAGEPHGLVVLDLDGFQDVNDRLGHRAGDELLVMIAARLRGVLGPGDLLARTGGDEFAVLVPGTDRDVVATRADAVLETLRSPVEMCGYTLHVTASAGVRAADDMTERAHLLGDADMALNAAKAAGKDRVVWYDHTLRDRQTERIETVARLRLALGADEFAVYYQPIVDLGTSQTVAVEALVRWLPPGRPPIGPDRFIPAAEESGLIVALGEWVLRRACAEAATWHREHGVTLTVNVSPRQLTDDDFTAKVRRSLLDSGLPATALTLEITEGILVSAGTRSAQALDHLEALRADGIRIAVDDFGTGYSSLAYLRDLPIDTLKIDKSLMPADEDDHRQVALVRTVVDMARSLGLTTVAEGVETPFHATLLHTLGCDRAQGYHFARPMPAADLIARRVLLPHAHAV